MISSHPEPQLEELANDIENASKDSKELSRESGDRPLLNRSGAEHHLNGKEPIVEDH